MKYRFVSKTIVVAAIVALLPALASGQQIFEQEPNDTCLEPQFVASVDVPVDISASLDSVDAFADVDFFRFSRPAGEQFQIDLEGASTGQGTLSDPVLGVFDSQCVVFAIDDDNGVSVNSRLIITVPDDGQFIVAASSYPDFSFVGGGVGSYRLLLDRVRVVESIEGRLVDSQSGVPLSGQDFPFATVSLFSCDMFGCFNFAGFTSAGPDGRFRFDPSTVGQPLQTGVYQIRTNAVGYLETVTDEFDALENQAVDLGDIAIVPLTFIGTVSGRLVDANDGAPLTGFGPPFAVVEFQQCGTFGCFSVVAAQPDLDGRFSIEGPLYQLQPGEYRIVGRAEDYQPAESAIYVIGAHDDLDVGEFALSPQPIQFGAATPCEITQPFGNCQYSLEIRNRGNTTFRGVAWSNIEYFGTGPVSLFSRFQVGEKGVADATPRKLQLAPGESVVLGFGVRVPATVEPGSTLCGTISVGELPGRVFQPLGDRFIFCATKSFTRYDVLGDKEGRRLYRELTSERAPAQRQAR